MDDYKYACTYADCEMKYNTKFNLQRHVNTCHLDIRNFQCSHCSKRFPSKQSCREHSYIHTDEKPFECHYKDCNKHFRQSSQLAVHHKIHKRKNDALKDEKAEIENEFGTMLPDITLERQLREVKLPLPASLLAASAQQ